MPNTFAFIALFAWPLVAILLFRVLPKAQALVWTILGAYLLLPERTGINLPMIPAIDKASLPAVVALVMCLLVQPRHEPGKAPETPPPALSQGGRQILAVLLGLVLLTPFLTVLQNSDPVVAGPRIVPGLRPYDAIALVGGLLITLIPFLLALRFLATPATHRMLLFALVVAMLAYTLPMLIEIRLSPQLSRWVYGFFPHSWTQHIRDGAFRPVVFLNHGLWLGILMAMAVVAASALWRQALRERVSAAPWLWATAWLFVILVLSRNLGATALALLTAPLILFTGLRLQLLVAAVVASIVLSYPMLRGAGWIPTAVVVDVAEKIHTERAQSLNTRLYHEDQLLAHAAEKPLGGWGTWGRNRIYDQDTGSDLSITDGYWVLVIGSHGWLGYLGRFGLLTLPLVLLAFRRRTDITPATAGLAMVLAVAVIDLIPNATISPVTWLVAGALAGYAFRVPARDEATARPSASTPQWAAEAPAGPLRPVGAAGHAARSAEGWPARHRRRPRN